MKRKGRLYRRYLLRSLYSLKILPRWVIILIDLVLIGLSTALGYSLRFNFVLEDMMEYEMHLGIATAMFTGLLAIFLSSSYKGIVRHTGLQDGARIFFMLTSNLAILSILNFISNQFFSHNFIPISVTLISFLASFLFLFNYRLLVKYVFSIYNRQATRKSNVLIYGAGSRGMITKTVMQSSPTSRVVGFIDNDKSKIKNVINGTRIFDASLSSVEELLTDYRIDEVIITVQDLPQQLKNELVELCLKYQVKVRVVPPIDQWAKGELSLNQIKQIKIEDLLERETIRLDDENLVSSLRGKRICVTGAAGSIGSEIVRQVTLFEPQTMILIDQAESPLFEIDRELAELKRNGTKIFTYVADITNQNRIDEIFASHRPDMIFHAAAYKHVPLMEGNPYEAVTCNILGTKKLADLAIKYDVEKFVMVSTDKAVNPTSVMGCSKRIAEIYVQALNKHMSLARRKTAFVTTRFGNVMGSNGSVIPLFKKQIDQGGPVTVTHPEITRYFMTIPEACRLVLEAGVMGRGGEIFIFDMGQSVKVYDLAVKMIQLSGLRPNQDIDIVFTGLREGEKLYEELLNQKENTIKTHHDKIMIGQVREYSYPDVNRYVELFYDLIHDKNELKMVTLMKELVPEFKSNYSRFEVLDSKDASKVEAD